MRDERQKDNKDTQALTAFNQQLVAHLESVLQPSSYEPDLTTFRHILLSLPQDYQTLGQEVIAERVINDIKLHFLKNIAIFSETAEQEGIEREERDATLGDARALTASLLQINKLLSIESLEDLVKLSNITTGLRTVSKANSAERAQRWIYKIPVLYRQRLEQQNLISQDVKFTVTISVDRAWLAHNIWNTPLKTPQISLPREVKIPFKSLQEQQYSIEDWRGKLLVPSQQNLSETGKILLPRVG